MTRSGLCFRRWLFSLLGRPPAGGPFSHVEGAGPLLSELNASMCAVEKGKGQIGQNAPLLVAKGMARASLLVVNYRESWASLPCVVYSSDKLRSGSLRGRRITESRSVEVSKVTIEAHGT